MKKEVPAKSYHHKWDIRNWYYHQWNISLLKMRKLSHCKTIGNSCQVYNMQLWLYGLSPPVKYFTDRSKAVLLLWIFYMFLFCLVFAMSLCASVYMCFGHMLGKGWPLGSRLWCLTVSLSLSHWYPGSGVVLHCIDSWSLHPYLLSIR